MPRRMILKRLSSRSVITEYLYLRNEHQYRNDTQLESRHKNELHSSPYLNILQDDDIMLPGFLHESVRELEKYPHAAFSYTLVRYIDIDGNPLHVQDEPDVRGGLINGLDFLNLIVAGKPCVTEASSVLMKASALLEVGPFDNIHTQTNFDRNQYTTALQNAMILASSRKSLYITEYTKGRTRNYAGVHLKE